MRGLVMPPSLSDALARAGSEELVTAAEALRPDRSLRHPRLREAAALLESGRLGQAKSALQDYLKRHPRDANALRLLAETAIRAGRNDDAEALLVKCLDLAPDFSAARFGYANVLLRTSRPDAALAQADELLRNEPRNPLFRALKAAALEAIEDHSAAAVLWRELVTDYPDRPDWWVRCGHALRGIGLLGECVAAYRKAIELDPSSGGAWWSLADLKTFRFSRTDIDQMESQLARADLPPEDRTRLNFALGKAYGDYGLYEKSFACYARGNAIHRLAIKHDPDVLTAYVARCKQTFTLDVFRGRSLSGCTAGDPIFVIGMARSGSTLVEQILASHSRIEGTRELSDLAAISNHLQNEVAHRLGARYPDVLEKLDEAHLKSLGERYLASVRAHRKLGRPFFTDKMGANFVHVGLLQLILPNAKIVDVRRHPLACGLSNFAQLFPSGQNNAYRLGDIGRLYRDYVELMAHFDSVLPGKVHRVIYEDLVKNPEDQIRCLLAYLGLPFEQACLRPHTTDRVITTASSEQVRNPIHRDALDRWRHYEPWLGPLIESLGTVLTAYPSVPAELC